jgi:hypothetical protein
VNCTVTDSGGLTASGSFTVEVTPLAVESVSVTGGAYFMHSGYQEKMSLNVETDAGVVQPGSWVNYYYVRTRMNLVSTGITSVVVSGNTASITGTAKVNNVAGYTFVLTVTDGSPDRFGITIYKPTGALHYTYSDFATGGDLIID